MAAPSINRGRVFASERVSIISARLLLVAVVFLYTLADARLRSKSAFWVCLAGYLLFITGFSFLKRSTLSLKRVRLIPAVIDVFFITLLSYSSGEPRDPWFFFFMFPIISASRYLGPRGAVLMAAYSIGMYLMSFYLPGGERQIFDLYDVTLRCLVLLGVAVVAGNLAHGKQKEQDKLIRVVEEIDAEILSNAKVEKILNLILRKCLEFTNSRMGHIRLRDRETGKYPMVTVAGHPEGYDWGTMPFDESYSQIAIAQKEVLIVPQIKTANLRHHLGTYFGLRKPRPKSALFFPMKLKDQVTGVIAVYSPKRFHYFDFDANKLTAFTTLIELALKTSEARDRHNRLQLLNEIGDELKSADLTLPTLFKRVVELTISHLDSEEAALFVRNDADRDRIEKVEVCGPDELVTAKLRAVETSYAKGESLTGKVFRDNDPKLENQVAVDEQHAKQYSAVLPSRTVRHYLGVPLVVDNEVLGVIRVVNKRSPDYSAATKFSLSNSGFRKEDSELMTTIASLVAPEIRSAGRRKKLAEAEQYLKNLLVESPDPIIAIDKRGKITIFNKACEKLWGVDYKQVEGQSVKNYYETPEEAREIGKMLAEAPHRVANVETRIRTRDGDIIPINLSAALLFDEDNNVKGSIGVFRDIRDYKRMQEDLVQATRLSTLATLSGTAGHEIKHNIGAALGFIDGLLAKRDRERDAAVLAVYTDIKDALEASRDELQDLLMANMTPRHKEPWDLENILRRVEQRLRRKAAQENIELSVKYPDEKYYLSADINQIARIFSNLFTNSRDAIRQKADSDDTFSQGAINISSHVDSIGAHLHWTDNGCGIPEDERNKIFDLFYTNKQGELGSGLGLHIVKTIVEAHGGQITAASTATGAKFCMTFPVLSADDD
jgi:two-component system, NtrC family, sensor kinase